MYVASHFCPLNVQAVQRLLAILKRASEECLLSVAVFEQYVSNLVSP